MQKRKTYNFFCCASSTISCCKPFFEKWGGGGCGCKRQEEKGLESQAFTSAGRKAFLLCVCLDNTSATLPIQYNVFNFSGIPELVTGVWENLCRLQDEASSKDYHVIN